MSSTSEPPCDLPCADCPWLASSQTPAAVLKSPVDARGVHWFDHENLERHWRGVSDVGALLPCHKTDPNAPLYGGVMPGKANAGRICVGLAILAKREVQAFMQDGTNYDRYAARPGKRWSLLGLAAWAARLYFGGATLHVENRAFVLPENVGDGDDPPVTVPWADSIHNAMRGHGKEEEAGRPAARQQRRDAGRAGCHREGVLRRQARRRRAERQ